MNSNRFLFELSHINFVVKKLRYILHKFRQLTEIMDQKQKNLNDYSLVVWDRVSKTHLRVLEVIQDKKKLMKKLMIPINYKMNQVYFIFYKIIALTHHRDIGKVHKLSLMDILHTVKHIKFHLHRSL